MGGPRWEPNKIVGAPTPAWVEPPKTKKMVVGPTIWWVHPYVLMWIHPPGSMGGSTYTNVQAAGAAGHCYKWSMELDRDDIRQGIEGNRMDRKKGAGAGPSRSCEIGPVGVPKSPERAGP
ncbi:hypothetical protein B0H17DRAFT_1123886 [Mycena rosella]|uniref:Uncharacterized protein n=1 Tax=Mycena rosella TaxID=1033263 RepID=A0AAD7H377_MYCRO|nr:hypothetical protein B0H17DRAFT_1123886 [Mycena rosella]